MDTIQSIFSIAIFIISVMMHEVSHGYMANYLGDPTAKYAGRLTLNPIKHIDWFGSILLPFILIISHAGFVFGWAKPVPYNPYNLKNQKWGDLLVAVAGPVSNLALAAFFGIAFRILGSFGLLNIAIGEVLLIIVFINVLLAIFNLVPIPPLDGSKIVMTFLPYNMQLRIQRAEPYFMIILILFIFTLWQYVFPVIGYVGHLLTGVSF